MKLIYKLFLSLCILFGVIYTPIDTVEVAHFSIQTTHASNGSTIINLSDLADNEDISLSGSTPATLNQAQGAISDMLINIGKSVRTILYVLAALFFLIISIRLIVASNTEEELERFKKGIIWITIGIIIINFAGAIVSFMYDTSKVRTASSFDFNTLATNILNNIISPTILLLETAAAFFFLLIAIFAFFRLVTANGNDEEARRGRMTIVYAVIGFILIILAKNLVNAVYGVCSSGGSSTIFGSTSCTNTPNLSNIAVIVLEIIKWLNSFVAVAVILMIIYSGISIMFSGGNEEKISNAKKSILYIIIGIAILIVNFLIVTFLFNIK